jgi:hypothetical protein
VSWEIVLGTLPAAVIAVQQPGALILSGSPASGWKVAARMLDPGLCESKKPVLGICDGFQATTQRMGGEFEWSGVRTRWRVPGIGRGLSPRRKPPWSEWEIRFETHARERMSERGLNETEARRLLEHARQYARGRRAGRWLVVGALRGARWVIVIRPEVERPVVVVLTVFKTKGRR